MSQPRSSGKKKQHRVYIPAEWAEPGAGGGAPKLSGGFEMDMSTGDPAPRSFNRPDQRYQLDAMELQARRIARANDEYATTLAAQSSLGRVVVRPPSGNIYHIVIDDETCDCPDYLRLQQSGRGEVMCKHRVIAIGKIEDVGGYQNLPWSSWKVAEYLGVALSTAERYFEDGLIPGLKVSGMWIAGADGTFMAAMAERAEHLSALPLPLDMLGPDVVE